MKKLFGEFRVWLPLILCVLLLTYGADAASSAVTAFYQESAVSDRRTVVIDAGHGGEDGGASTASNIPESQINLQIASKLDALLQLLGIQTAMIRTTDISVYTEGKTLAQKKVSDLKRRVQLINETENALLLSIHQNYYPDSRYWGAQVFYAKTEGSKQFAGIMQAALVGSLNAGSNRKEKVAQGIYLMDHIKCAGVLIECGFLSNPSESEKLTDPIYQNNIVCVIASVCSCHLGNTAS